MTYPSGNCTTAPVVSKNNSLILGILTDDVVVEIFALLGPLGTATCSTVCQQWNRITRDSRSLWRHFVARDFRLDIQMPESADDSSSDNSDWRLVYAYLTQRAQVYRRDDLVHDRQPPRTSLSSAASLLSPRLDRAMFETRRALPGRVVFSDDGSAIPGYPPENVIRPGRGAWCTNSQVDRDVDLVVELKETCLIGGFVAANGGSFYSAPLKEALVFASLDPINLDDARRFNGAAGSAWVQRIVSTGGSSSVENLQRQQQHNENNDNLVAAFRFPPVPKAFGARMYYRLHRPICARFIHFKLLASYNSNDGRISDNIDVLDLHTLGVDVKELPELLKRPNLNDRRQPDPSYTRMHKIRTYVPLDDPMPMDGLLDFDFGHMMNPNNMEWLML